MPHDERAYLADVIEACQAIEAAISGLDVIGYSKSRLVRSSVEREFITIGEAVSALSRIAPSVFAAISNARRIVDFRNQLTHEYPTVDDELVWAIAETDIPRLKTECVKLLEAAGAAPGPANE
jgi:uncharacterized protein with HEPN domain